MGQTVLKVTATGRPVAVLAAGAICWRLRKDELEVLLIHRPRYDDWSWPKGKLDPGETMPEAAVREVREETGLHITLGQALADVYYQVSSGLKEVRYWAAQVDGPEAVPDGKEVDKTQWCSAAKALTMLTNPSDREPLEKLSVRAAAGELDTWPLILLRHAKAKPRSSWTKAEGDRTLAATGARQALSDSKLLLAWRPARVVTSSWTRCLATVAPYAQASGAKVKQTDVLTEASHKRKPRKVRELTEKLLDKGRPVVLCTHRPVLPTVLNVLRGRLTADALDALPTSDPYLSPGEIVVCQVANAKVVCVERYKPFED